MKSISRTNQFKDEIKAKDIYTALLSGNCLVEIKPNGKRIAEALEHGVAGIEAENGWFPPIHFKLDFPFVPPPMETFQYSIGDIG